MDAIPITLTSLRLLITATLVVQVGLLVAVPIPSPVATRRMLPWRRSSGNVPAELYAPPDPWPVLLLPPAALAGPGLVLAAVFSTGVVDAIVPLGTRSPSWLAPTSVVALLAGNGLVAAAALTLKRRTTFGSDGHSAGLVTGGIFGLVRHPIVLGLGLIYLGLFLALPSPWLLVGLLCFGRHQQRRLVVEEAMLADRFGQPYRDYRRRVGGLWPRWPGGPGP